METHKKYLLSHHMADFIVYPIFNGSRPGLLDLESQSIAIQDTLRIPRLRALPLIKIPTREPPRHAKVVFSQAPEGGA